MDNPVGMWDKRRLLGSFMKQFTSKTQKIGEYGEEQAVVFLMKQGFSIVDRNVSNKYGEIDIIGKKGSAYYFFEVKAGKYGGFVNPAENLTPVKLRKFLISVEHYCFIHKIKDYRVQGIIVLLKNETVHSVECIDIY